MKMVYIVDSRELAKDFADISKDGWSSRGSESLQFDEDEVPVRRFVLFVPMPVADGEDEFVSILNRRNCWSMEHERNWPVDEVVHWIFRIH